MIKKTHRILLLFLGLAFILLASFYNIMTPPFEAPDEVGHYYFIFQVLVAHNLPNQYTSNAGEAQQPPLYYLLAGIGASLADLDDPTGAFRPNPRFTGARNGGKQVNAGLHDSREWFPYRGQALALHLARLVSTLMSAGTLILIFVLASEIFPDFPAVAWLATGLAALNPQFLFISGVINNDNLLVLLSTASWIVIYRIQKDPERQRDWWLAGLLFALAMLTKLNAVVIALVAGIFLILCAYRLRSWKYLFANLTRFSIPFFFINGWWLVRNQILYGDPIGWRAYSEIWAITGRKSTLNLKEIGIFLKTQFKSFFGMFGWMNVPASKEYFWIIFLIMGFGLIGLALYIIRHAEHRKHFSDLIFLFLIILVQEGVQFGFILNRDRSFYQGRYLFPVIGPLMIFIGMGLLSWAPRHPKWVIVPLTGFLLIAVIYMPLKVIRPAYPSFFQSMDRGEFHPANARSPLARLKHIAWRPTAPPLRADLIRALSR